MEEIFKTKSGKWDLEKIVRVCEKELRKIRIPILIIRKIHVVSDKYVFGRVDQRYYDKTWFDLYISNSYRSTKHDLAEVKTIICHLLLHTVKGCMNHDGRWMKYADAVDKQYGLHITEYISNNPQTGRNRDESSGIKTTVLNSGICCYLDYQAKLEAVMQECSEQLVSIGFNVGSISEIRFSMDNYNLEGYSYRKNRDDSYTIFIPYRYVNRDADEIGLRRLICHELLHTCPEDDSVPHTGWHGPRWRQMARKVERELGYRIMSQSHSDAARKTSGEPIMRYVCPVCGGYYNVYKDDEMWDEVECTWCHYNMNAVREEDFGILDNILLLIGEMGDKLRIADIPIGILTGVGFVPAGCQTGIHDNWNGKYSLDLPEGYRCHGVVNEEGFKAYLCNELLRTCSGEEDRFEEYIQKAEKALGIPLRQNGLFASETGEEDSTADAEVLI